MSHVMTRSAAEETLCALGAGDLHALDGAPRLDPETEQLVQIAALVALGGSQVSWVAQLEGCDEVQLDLAQVLGTLAAIAPIVGSVRVVSAGTRIVHATGLD